MLPLTRRSLLTYLRRHRYAVEASAAPQGGAQAAVVGIAVSDEFEIVFDTVDTTRKARNLARDPHIALVIGGTLDGEEETLQYEGLADRPEGVELEAIKALYFETFPDGRERLSWPGIIHLRVKPTWLRYSDFRRDPPFIVELTAAELVRLR